MRKNAVLEQAQETNAPWRQCARKTRYSKKDAITMAKARATSGKAKKIGYYECDYCQGWHLTHKIKEEL